MKLPFVIACLVSVPFHCHGEEEEWIAFDLLSGRLRVEMPPETFVEARRVADGAAPQSQDGEARLIHDQGEARMVLMTYELFQRAGEGFRERVLADLSRNLTRDGEAPVVSERSPTLFVGRPPHSTEEGNSLFTTALLVAPDQTLLQLDFHFDSERASDPDACAATVERVLASLQAGERVIDLGAGPRVFSSGGGMLEITVPDGWTFSSQRGEDFLVHHFTEVPDYGEPASTFSIYIGRNPQLLYRRPRVVLSEIEEFEAELAGPDRSWVRFLMENGGGRRFVECAVTSGEGGPALHFFGSVPDAGDVMPLVEIAGTLRQAGAADAEAGESPDESAEESVTDE